MDRSRKALVSARERISSCGESPRFLMINYEKRIRERSVEGSTVSALALVPQSDLAGHLQARTSFSGIKKD